MNNEIWRFIIMAFEPLQGFYSIENKNCSVA